MKDERLATLTAKQRLWLEAYLQCLNATEAARRAGYAATNGSLKQLGYKNLNHPKIRPILDDLFEDVVMSATECKARISVQARGDIGDLEEALMERTPAAIVAKAKYLGVSHLIKKISQGPNGITVELRDTQKALELIGKHHKLFTEKHEHSFADMSDKTDDELKELAGRD